MNQDTNFCLQSLKDTLDNCIDKDLDVDDGKKKENGEVSRLEKTENPLEKSNDKEKKVENSKKEEEKREEEKTVKFSPTTSETSNVGGNKSQKRILAAKVRNKTI